MRILIDYRPALTRRTGVGEYTHEMARALAALLPRNDRLTLFSSSWKDRLEADRVPGAVVADARIPVRLLNFLWHRLEWPPVERLAGPVDIAHSMHPLLMPARRAAQVVTIYDLFFLATRPARRRDPPGLSGAGRRARPPGGRGRRDLELHRRRGHHAARGAARAAGRSARRVRRRGAATATCRPAGPSCTSAARSAARTSRRCCKAYARLRAGCPAPPPGPGRPATDAGGSEVAR